MAAHRIPPLPPRLHRWMPFQSPCPSPLKLERPRWMIYASLGRNAAWLPPSKPLDARGLCCYARRASTEAALKRALWAVGLLVVVAAAAPTPATVNKQSAELIE